MELFFPMAMLMVMELMVMVTLLMVMSYLMIHIHGIIVHLIQVIVIHPGGYSWVFVAVIASPRVEGSTYAHADTEN